MPKVDAFTSNFHKQEDVRGHSSKRRGRLIGGEKLMK